MMITGNSSAHRPLRKTCTVSFREALGVLDWRLSSLREMKNQQMLMMMVR